MYLGVWLDLAFKDDHTPILCFRARRIGLVLSQNFCTPQRILEAVPPRKPYFVSKFILSGILGIMLIHPCDNRSRCSMQEQKMFQYIC